jgi:hypothetical protein
MIIPVIIRATGIATKGLKKNLEAMLGKYSIDSLQKTALFRTSYIKLKVQQSETGSLSGRDRRCFMRSTSNKRPVTRENNGIIVIIIIIIIIIIHSTFKARSGESLKNKWDSVLEVGRDGLLEKTSIKRKKYYKQQQIANADCVNNSMRQQNTSYQHAQQWQKNNTKRGMIECVLNYTLTYAKKWG